MNAQASQATNQPEHEQAAALRSSQASLFLACAVMATILAPLAVVLGAVAFARSGPIGIGAAAIAGGVCWISASLALVVVHLGQELKNPIAGVLGSMVFRMGLPGAAAVAIQRAQGPLADAGCIWMILGLYAVALVVETWLSLRLVRAAQTSADVGGVPARGPSIASGISGR